MDPKATSFTSSPSRKETLTNGENSHLSAFSVNDNSSHPEAKEPPCSHPVSIVPSVLPVMNFAMYSNGIPMVQSILIENLTDTDIEHLDLQITSTPAFSMPFDQHIDLLPAGKTLEISKPRFILNGEFLSAMTEKTKGVLRFSMKIGNARPFSHYEETTILAYDQWHGTGVYPEYLSAFVTPNHPVIQQLARRGSDFLGQWTGDPSMDGYLSQDPNRVLSQAAAIYSAIKELQLSYALPPAGFELMGQRIRLCDTILRQSMGTCMDLTLLFASCLECIGLHPLLITTSNHIYIGLWLEDMMFPECLQDDVSLISKRLASGINEIAVVECTCMVKGKEYTFDEARAIGEKNLSEKPTEYVIDVRRCRLSQIYPLSQQGTVSGEKASPSQGVSSPSCVAPPTKLEDSFSPIPVTKEEALPKKVQWERKLLDLGMRNSLINLRLTKTQLPILAHCLDELENTLADGGDFTILPKPADWGGETISFDNLQEKSKAEIIRAEFQNKRIRSLLTEGELSKTIKELYRTSKTALEENGANTLYLALGMLRWYESPRSTKTRYAPIILLPIDLIRKSAAQGYVIRLRDEEAQMNITLLEKLKQDFSITVSGVDPLPADEHGIDIRKVFTLLRKAVMEQPHWDVLEAASIGIFSFSQFVMWNDIRNRSQDLMTSKVVRSLMDGKLSWDAQPLEMGDRVSEENILLPMAADASQLYAIRSACEGNSFVLHGPPGTGKSQTITTLIANALSKGNRVLFVAEKMAALEVVQKRLEKIGIGPFCLELHSNKSRKRDVLDQLRRASEVTKTTTAEAFAVKAQQLEHVRKELDSYAQQLHQPLPCGSSLQTLINEYEYYKDAMDMDAFDPVLLQGLDQSSLDRQQLLVERLVAAGEETGHPHTNPLSPIRCYRYSQSLRGELQSVVQRYKTQGSLLLPLVEAFTTATEIPVPRTYEELQNLALFASNMLCWYSMPGAWRKVSSPGMYFPQVSQMAEHYIKAKALEDKLLEQFEPGFLSLNGQELLGQWREVSGKWFLPKLLGTNKVSKTLRSYAKKPVEKEQIETHLTNLRDYRQESSLASQLLQTYGPDLEALYTGNTTDWDSILRLATAAQESAQSIYTLYGSYKFIEQYCGAPHLHSVVTGLHTAFPSFAEAKIAFDTLLQLLPRENARWLHEELCLCDRIMQHSDGLKEWIAYVAIAQEAREMGLENVVRSYEQGAPHDDIFPAYKKGLLQGLISGAIDQSECLNGFSGAVFNKKIQQYKEMDQEWCRLSQEEIYCRLASKVPNFIKEASGSSELGILQRCIKNGGRGTSIRKLFDQIPNLLPRLCPCMLMSPISAAQYLDPKSEPFDIVVFDEASQLPTCKAVGVLARGKNAIVVGDPKQMPPTSFFATNTVDEDAPDMEDLESILDDCLALNMPQSHLLWHYRSRHESLIAFSNSQFYENKLFTFPSVNDRESKVRLIRVDGTFDRGKTRTNKEEALAVVEEVKRRAKDPNLQKYSVGIVTFNISQQHLIDDLLSEACVKDPSLEQWMFQGEEPLFVKNLENVQGDERDVILFSVGFGPDQEGKLYMNFGPLNRDGGWRRLNVAVSRSRHEMLVFTTMSSDQLDLNRTKAEGVAALRKFLAYAEGKSLALGEGSIEKLSLGQRGIADTICKALKEQGYDTDLSIGRSKYRMDIGVIDPQNPDQYILGIMLDGATYGSAKTTRDREIAQIGVLNGLGWHILRLWAMDWWDNPQKELKRILDTLQTLQDRSHDEEDGAPPAETAPPEKEPTQAGQKMAPLNTTVQKPVPDYPNPPVYSVAHLPVTAIAPENFTDPSNNRLLQGKIKAVLSAEAPISLQNLIRRVTQGCGISRAGTRIQNHLVQLLETMSLPTTRQEDTVFYWNKNQNPQDYRLFRTAGEGENRRDIRDVSTEEIANAVYVVLYEQISMGQEDLYREIAAKLGYVRMGTNMHASLLSGIRYAISQGGIAMGNKGSYILSPEGTAYAETVLKNF